VYTTRLVPLHRGAFSVVATIEDEPVGLINCFQGFSTFKCKPLVNIHDVFVAPQHRRKGVTQVMMAKVSEVGKGGSAFHLFNTGHRAPSLNGMAPQLFFGIFGRRRRRKRRKERKESSRGLCF
jgi:GNAT superfamily N-acetyltransferase